MKSKTQKRSADKMKIIMGFVIAALVILGMGVYFLSAGSLELSETLTFPVIIFIVLLAIYVMIKRTKAYRAGLPFDDELEKKIKWKAGYYTFLVTIYVALGTSWYVDAMEEAGTPLPARYAAYIILLASAIVYFLFYFYFNRKGDV